MSQRVVRQILIMLGVAFLLAGCVQSAKHRESMENIQSVTVGQGLTKAITLMETERDLLSDPDKNTGNRSLKASAAIIDLLEIGALYHYDGQFERSNEALTIVASYYGEQEDKAKISVSETAGLAVKSLVSEGLGGRYELSDYEKVFVHTLMALNYLMQGDLDSAAVEGRITESLHAWIRDKVEDENAKADADAAVAQADDSDDSPLESNASVQPQSAQAGVNPMAALFGGGAGGTAAQGQPSSDTAKNSIKDGLALSPEEMKIAGDLKDGYRNAMTYNLSAMVLELEAGESDGVDEDNAIIALRKSIELYDNGGVGDRFVKLIHARDQASDSRNAAAINILKNRYPGLVANAENNRGARPNFQVFVHTGDSPRVVAYDLSIPNPISGTISKLSIPKYKVQADESYKLLLNNDGLKVGPQLDFDSLALKSYADKLPGLQLRMVTRFIANTLVDREINKRAGGFGQILTAVKNQQLEQADTRSWTALPKVIHYGQSLVTTDSGRVQLKNSLDQVIYDEKFPVKDGKLTLVNIRKMGDKYIAKHVYLEPATALAKIKTHKVRLSVSSDYREQIRAAQRQLNELGFNAGVPDGDPGNATKAAVKSLLLSRNLQGDDGLDDQNQAAIKKAHREMVVEIQTLLNSKGFNTGKPDGLAGRGTSTAISKYQKVAGLTPDGRPTITLLEHMQQN
ncbi:MAG: peptidoglycan-binding protein [Sedimenticola sp.]